MSVLLVMIVDWKQALYELKKSIQFQYSLALHFQYALVSKHLFQLTNKKEMLKTRRDKNPVIKTVSVLSEDKRT